MSERQVTITLSENDASWLCANFIKAGVVGSKADPKTIERCRRIAIACAEAVDQALDSTDTP